MSGDNFYRPADVQLCQGDVVDEVPSVHLRPPMQAIKPVSLRGNRPGFEAHPWEAALSGKVGGVRFDFSRGENVSAFCQCSRAVVLSFDCEIDQDRKHLLVALIRPLAAVQRVEDQNTIRENRNFGFWYMPADERFKFDESYLDLRRITCLDQAILGSTRRLASLSHDALRSLQRQLILYLTRRELV
jgi:hypothetical protein